VLTDIRGDDEEEGVRTPPPSPVERVVPGITTHQLLL